MGLPSMIRVVAWVGGVLLAIYAALDLASGSSWRAKALRPMAITVYLDDATQDVYCRRILESVNDDASRLCIFDTLAREIESRCIPAWDPLMLTDIAGICSGKSSDHHLCRALALDGVYQYEAVGEASYKAGHVVELPINSTMEEDSLYTVFDHVHFLVHFSDDSITWFGKRSPGEYHLQYGIAEDQAGENDPPYVQYDDARVEQGDEARGMRRPQLHLHLDRSLGYFTDSDHSTDFKVSLTVGVRVDFYRVSSTPCWDCSIATYIRADDETYAKDGHGIVVEMKDAYPTEDTKYVTEGISKPGALREQLLLDALGNWQNETVARRSAKKRSAAAQADLATQAAAVLPLFTTRWASVTMLLLALLWLVARQLDRRGRAALAAKALEAQRRGEAAEQARLGAKERKREIERLRQEHKLEALRRAERQKQADREAYMQTLEDREAERRRHELAMRERARRAAEAEEKPLSTPGPSHQEPKPKAGTVSMATSRTPQEQAREEVRKARSIEAQHAHLAIEPRHAAREGGCARGGSRGSARAAEAGRPHCQRRGRQAYRDVPSGRSLGSHLESGGGAHLHLGWTTKASLLRVRGARGNAGPRVGSVPIMLASSFRRSRGARHYCCWRRYWYQRRTGGSDGPSTH